MVIKKYKSKSKKKRKSKSKTIQNMKINTKTKKNIMNGGGYNQYPQQNFAYSQNGYPMNLNNQNEMNRRKKMIIKIIEKMIRNRKKIEKQKTEFKGKRAYTEIPEAY